MSVSRSPHYETKHDPKRPAGITQSESPQGGRHFIGFPSDSSAPAPRPFRAADYLGECEFVRDNRNIWRRLPGTNIWTFIPLDDLEQYSARATERTEAERTRPAETGAPGPAAACEARESEAAAAREAERTATVAACKAECAEFFVAAFSAIYPRANPDCFRAAIARALNPS